MTGPFFARLFLIACLLLATPGGVAHAEETLIWTGRASDGLVSLSYGPVDPAKTPVFFLSCFDVMGIAVLNLRHDIEDAKQGEPLTITLSAGGATAEVKGEVASDESGGTTLAEASDIAVKPVLEVLRQEGPVTVTTGKTNATLSDNGRAQAVKLFSDACPLD
jgi:hypothetical protein